MSDTQKARDYADQKQLTADIINYSEHKHYEIDGEQADAYLQELFESNFPKLRTEAMRVASACANEMASAVIADVCDIDPELLQNLRRPNVQAALLSAQQSYAETGNPDTGKGDSSLGLLLSRLVVKVVTNPSRSLTDIVTRRAIAIAPHLTRQQIHSLAMLSVWHTCTFRGGNASELLAAMNDFFQSYFDDVAVNHSEFSYMESVGVGSVSLMTGWADDPFEKICSDYRAQLRNSFSEADIPAEVDSSDRIRYLEQVPDAPGTLVLRAETMDALLGNDRGVDDFEQSMKRSKSERALTRFVSERQTSPEGLRRIAAVETPGLHSCFTATHNAGGFGFQLNTIGYVLAKQELDLRFPNNSLLEHIIATAPTDET